MKFRKLLTQPGSQAKRIITLEILILYVFQDNINTIAGSAWIGRITCSGLHFSSSKLVDVFRRNLVYKNLGDKFSLVHIGAIKLLLCVCLIVTKLGQ